MIAETVQQFGIDPKKLWTKSKVLGLWVEITEAQRQKIIDVLIKRPGYSHLIGSSPPSWGIVECGGIVYVLESAYGEPELTLARVH